MAFSVGDGRPKDMRAVVIGGGGFARELMCWMLDANAAGGSIVPTAYVDDAGDVLGGSSYGLEFLGTLDDFRPTDDDTLFLAVGDPTTKAAIVARMGGAHRFGTVIHPGAVVARTAKIAHGCIVGPNAYIAADSVMEECVTVNSLTGVGHDARVGRFSTISSQVDLMGGVTLGERTFVGSGARVLPKVKVGEAAKLGAGAIVVRTVKPGASVYASPAKSL